jgi:hypothetical protein
LDPVDVGEVPLAVLKNLKGAQYSQWPIDPIEHAAALSLSSLQFAPSRVVASEVGHSANPSTVLDLSSPGSPQVLPLEPVITKIYSPYENVSSTTEVDMEATLSPIRKYFRSVRGSSTPLQQGTLVMAPIQEESASIDSVKGEDLDPPPVP